MQKSTFCGAKNRPGYCKVDTNMCCVNCEYIKKCVSYAKKFKLMKPCVPDNFEPDEMCEFSI